jgi:aminoglycoside 3-N-acetyltransferase
MTSTPVLVHTDITRLDRSLLKNLESGETIIDRSFNLMSGLTSGLETWFPAFNYQFGNVGVFDLNKDRVEVGFLNEEVRASGEFYRSKVPIFSILRQCAPQKSSVSENEIIEPFGPHGEFAELHKRDGQILLFGAQFNSLTIIHWVEEAAQIKYRYFKEISGLILSGNETKKATVRFRVRPKGLNLDYAWEKIEEELRNNAVLANPGKNIFSISVQKLHECLSRKLEQDEFWLLNDDSRAAIMKKRTELGRDFDIGDFE